MFRFQTVIKINDYYDQLSEGTRLNNDSLTGLSEGDKENVIIRREVINMVDAENFSIDLVNILGGTPFNKVDTVHMYCNYPQQYKDSTAFPVPCNVKFISVGGAINNLGAMSQFTMYHLPAGVPSNIVFGHIIIPKELIGVAEQFQLIIFINLKK